MLPAELVGSRPRLLLTRAVLALTSGRVEAVEGPLDAAERALAGAAVAAEEPSEPSVGRAASLVANLPATIAVGRAAELRGDADREITFAHQAQAKLGEGEWMLDAYTRLHLAVAEWLRGRLPEAERALETSLAGWRAAGERFLAALSCHYLGQVQRAQGRLGAALATYRQALEVAAPPDRPALPGAGIAYVGLAEVAYQRGELDTAVRHVADGIGLCRQLGYRQPLASGLASLAWIRQASGDPAAALEAIGEAERVAPGPGVASLLNSVPAQRARLLLAWGDLAGALQWIKECGLVADPAVVSYPREREHLVLARVLVAQGRPDQALEVLEPLHAAAAAQGRSGSVIEIQAVAALARWEGGDQAGASAVLDEALAVAWPEGYVRVFVDEGAPMAALVGGLVAAQQAGETASGVPLSYLRRLLQAFEQDAVRVGWQARRGTAAVPDLVEPLSDREFEVLRLVAVGRPNREIAEELGIVLDTVKKHVGRVLDKLGAANRTQAVARARELGLLR